MHDLLDTQSISDSDDWKSKLKIYKDPKYQVKTGHFARLKILQMVMEKWGQDKGVMYSEGDDIIKVFQEDWDWLEDLLERMTHSRGQRLNGVDMKYANLIFFRWSGEI